MEGFQAWMFLAGVCIFVYSMNLLEYSTRNLVGRSFKKFLYRNSKRPVNMLVASTGIAAILQSSSIVILVVLSFVSAGIMNMRGAIASMLGCNLGSTLDSWVIALVGFKFDISELAFPVMAIALPGLLFTKRGSKLYYWTIFLIGFALIFVSLEWLKESMSISSEGLIASVRNYHYLFFILIGVFITAIIQSSSAIMAITLSALFNQLIPFESAAAMVAGSELGTTLKFLVISTKGIPDKKRVAWGNFIVNLVIVIVSAIIIVPLTVFIQEILSIADPLTGLVVFQAIINVIAIIIFFPILGWFAEYLGRKFRGNEEQLTKFIQDSSGQIPAHAIDDAEKEIYHLFEKAIQCNREFILVEKEERWLTELAKGTEETEKNYERIKLLHGAILENLSLITHEELNKSEAERINSLIDSTRHLLRSVKNMKDISHNMREFKESATDEIFQVFEKIKSDVNSFYDEISGLSKDNNLNVTERLKELFEKNRNEYDESIRNTIHLLRGNKISEVDSSTLLNVYRETYSSNQALLRSLAGLKGSIITIEE